ncbi:MAG: ATP-binding protein [Nitrospira sp.]
MAKHPGTGGHGHAGPGPASQVLITVADDGCRISMQPCFFWIPSGTIRGRFGLFNVQERIEAIGGTVSLKSSEGSGTTITLSAPLTAFPDSRHRV